jgi:predicted CoA-binding protein
VPKAAQQAHVAVLGASPKPDRYSFKAVNLLKEHGFQPIPVHPAGHEVAGIPGVKSLDEITAPIDTLSVYVNAGVSGELKNEILRLKPRRVVFNPGAENPVLREELDQVGVETVEHCTLVMLRSDLF